MTGNAASAHQVLHRFKRGYQAVTKSLIFSTICKHHKKVSFKIKGLELRPIFVQFNEITGNQRKIPGAPNISSELSTAFVESFSLEQCASRLQPQHENHMTVS
ncbi:hypothetical protein [Aestuariivita boseongensis]|uniref:hypothetical protein n=1 Tax=Aestuariivita boseongensis TaxID=1470562 RepID=UPI0012F829C9|nr:hypothetical protein [Aestuariivita boseongensis]